MGLEWDQRGGSSKLDERFIYSTRLSCGVHKSFGTEKENHG